MDRKLAVERVVLSRIGPNMRIYLNKEVVERLKVEEGDQLAWQLEDGEVKVFKARMRGG